ERRIVAAAGVELGWCGVRSFASPDDPFGSGPDRGRVLSRTRLTSRGDRRPRVGRGFVAEPIGQDLNAPDSSPDDHFGPGPGREMPGSRERANDAAAGRRGP